MSRPSWPNSAGWRSWRSRWSDERERVRRHHPDPVDPRVAEHLGPEGRPAPPHRPCQAASARRRPCAGLCGCRSNRPVIEGPAGLRAQSIDILVKDLEHLGAERLGDALRPADRLRERQSNVEGQPRPARHPAAELRERLVFWTRMPSRVARFFREVE